MICLFRGSGPTDAFLLRDWLARNRVPAQVHGVHRMGLLGEVPVCEAWPTVWVSKADAERAKALLDQWLGPQVEQSDWECPGCGEANGPASASCWSCARDR